MQGIQDAFADIWKMNTVSGKANIGRDLVQQSIGLTFGQGQGPAFFEKTGCTQAATDGRTGIEYVPFVTSSLMDNPMLSHAGTVLEAVSTIMHDQYPASFPTDEHTSRLAVELEAAQAQVRFHALTFSRADYPKSLDLHQDKKNASKEPYSRTLVLSTVLGNNRASAIAYGREAVEKGAKQFAGK